MDQAYRLPLLLHRQSPALFADDPFVRSFDAFNPHRGYLALLDAASRAVGLSAGLALLFGLTFAATCLGLDRLGRAAWPEAGPRVGVVAVGLVLAARAGNIGTNHLFEPMLLDRLIGFALGWLALAVVVDRPDRGWRTAPLAIVLATLIHPSVGLQLAMLLGAAWIGWSPWPCGTGVGWTLAARGLGALVVGMVLGLAPHLGQGAHLFQGLPPEEFRLLSVELQGPQHMLPHLWRWPQWLAWGCYPVLAVLALVAAPAPSREGGSEEPFVAAPSWPRARTRLAVLMAINLAGLGLAWVAVERLHDLRVTLFQPFRMATVLRGLALVALSGRVLALWRRGGWADRARAALLAVGPTGDWSLVVVTAFEVASTILERPWNRLVSSRIAPMGDLRRVRCADRNIGAIESFGPHSGPGKASDPGDSVSIYGPADAVRTPPFPLVGEGRGGGSISPCAGAHSPPTFRSVARGLSPAWAVLAWGLTFLARHDTESGHFALIGALAAVAAVHGLGRVRWFRPSPRRLTWATVAAWAVPLAALAASGEAARGKPWARTLVGRCRFAAVPTDDVERLAVWCREHTPASARFIGPPGPKTFRLWSLRSLAFNRAASPYHAEGLADWSARFRDHVGFRGSTAAFVRAYLADRHGLERRYQAMSDEERAALARRQGATHVIAAPRPDRAGGDGPLELLHVEGRYAVSRVRGETRIAHQGTKGAF